MGGLHQRIYVLSVMSSITGGLIAESRSFANENPKIHGVDGWQ
jgi:hypothetical protein